jgi:single-stranded-DNA-specific exonuclease
VSAARTEVGSIAAEHRVLPERWIVATPDQERASALAEEARLPVVLAELLCARGITDARQAHDFLHPDQAHLYDPLLMLGMASAAERLERAIARKETVLLYGDYDVDGTVAVLLLKTAIEMLGGVVRFHVPHRLREGYGLQASVLEAAWAEGVRLVVTVDTGMRACLEAEAAKKLGLDLIITDHHLPKTNDRPPAALAILNPNQPGCPYPEKSLCGAAIALKLAQVLLERHDPVRLREKILPSFLKMAAIATIADAVPLRGENRVIAALGLRELRRPASAGLRALFAVAGLDPTRKELTGFDIAFRLAPRINAAGRMDVASEVIELFSTRDPVRSAELADKLERLNRERREAEARVLAEIELRLKSELELASERLLLVDGVGWHRGLIGILAARVMERTAKPAIIVTVEDGIAHGSGRSVDGFPLLRAIESCSGLFTRFGGHAFAIGFAMPAAALPELRMRLRTYAELHLAAYRPERLLRIHAELPLDCITPVLAGWLGKLEPMGHSNPQPVFVARRVRILCPPRVMKERHLCLELSQEPDRESAGMPDDVQASPSAARPLSNRSRAARRAVGWGMAERARALGLKAGSLIDLAYRIRENAHPNFGGLEVEILGMEVTTR